VRSKGLLVTRTLVVLACLLCGGSLARAQDGFCGLDVADACTRQLGVPWKKGPKTSLLEDEPITSMADLKGAFEEMGVVVFATTIDNVSLPIVRRIFIDQGVVGIIRVESDDADVKEAGIGHYLMVTGFVSSDEMAAYDASTREVRNVRYLGNEGLPILLLSTEKISLPTLWRTVAQWIATGMGSFGLTPILAIALIGIAAMPVYSKILRRRQAFVMVGVIAMLVPVGVLGYRAYRRTTDEGIAFERSIYSLGRYKVGAKASQTATVVNRYQHPVEAKQLTASCNCMSVEFKPGSIAAGQTLEIPVEFASVSPGLSRYSITLETDFRTSACEFQMVGESSLAVFPKSAFVGSISLNDPQPLVHRVTLGGSVEGPVELKEIVAHSKDGALAVDRYERGPALQGKQLIVGDTIGDGSILDIYVVATENASRGGAIRQIPIDGRVKRRTLGNRV
jgi:hypothetical protein